MANGYGFRHIRVCHLALDFNNVLESQASYSDCYPILSRSCYGTYLILATI